MSEKETGPSLTAKYGLCATSQLAVVPALKSVDSTKSAAPLTTRCAKSEVEEHLRSLRELAVSTLPLALIQLLLNNAQKQG